MRGALNCGVVAIPKTGALIDGLLDYYDNLPDYPAWWGNKQKRKMDKLDRSLPKAVRIYQTERTAFGPQAFTHFATKTGDIDKAMAGVICRCGTYLRIRAAILRAENLLKS